MVRRSVILASLEETHAFAKQFAKKLSLGDVVCFFGDLGAGKTTFIKSIIAELTLADASEVTSPTFNYCHSYDHVHHFDLYRFESEKQFLGLGFDEFFRPENICLIEWSERIKSILPLHCWKIHMEVIDESKRKLCYEKDSISNGQI